jgi:ribosome-associated toxin RatA of RatAB toxin-antitoxin module
VGVARAATLVPIPPGEAYDQWTDVSRWPTFVDGFGHPERLDDEWPAVGAKIVWKGVPGGRGAVTEKVTKDQPGVLHEVVVFEEKLDGTQRVTFTPDEEGTRVDLELDYKVSVGGPLRPVVDTLFIRRAQNDALARTLRRFATEAGEQAAL